MTPTGTTSLLSIRVQIVSSYTFIGSFTINQSRYSIHLNPPRHMSSFSGKKNCGCEDKWKPAPRESEMLRLTRARKLLSFFGWRVKKAYHASSKQSSLR